MALPDEAAGDGSHLFGRRSLFGAAIVGGLGLAAGRAVASQPTLVDPGAFGLSIQPRDAWGAGSPPTGPLEAEAPGDVRFLLVHHTVNANDYPPDAVPGLIQGIYGLHTGDRGWPDVAYNFFVDQHGGVWEGRAGSLDEPMKADATGGSQGFAQLGSFVGDHRTVPPTDAAQNSMVRLLAWLASRYGIDTSPGTTVEFVSRGSNRHPAGTTVTTTTIAGHRDMSQTECPGDAAYRLVQESFPGAVEALRATTVASTTTAAAPTTVPPSTATASPDTASPPLESEDFPWGPVAIGGALGLALFGGAVAVRRRLGS